MNKKSTLLAAALMAVSSLTVSAEGLKPDKCEKGHFYYLKADDSKYLSLEATKTDNVVIGALDMNNVKAEDIASHDLALWEITPSKTKDSYLIKNKRTKAVLSFNPESKADPVVLDEGAYEWNLTGAVTAKYGADKTLTLYLSDGNKIAFKGSKELELEISEPNNDIELGAKDLKPGFDSFKLSFGEDVEDNIFEGKEFVAVPIDGTDYVKLQVKGKDQYLGIGKESLNITGATGAYGAKFQLYSEADFDKDNENKIDEAYREFKFSKLLKNDSLTIKVRKAPNFTGDEEIEDVSVVYTAFGGKKYLTVGGNIDSKQQGEILFSTVWKSDPVTDLEKGVYFLKSANKKEGGHDGEYIYGGEDGLAYMVEKPSKYLVSGQWFLKPETGVNKGLYSLVDRENDSNILMKGEVFKVEGMDNTYTFGASADSITLELQDVDLNNRYIGSAYYSKEAQAKNGYVLNSIPTGMTESDLYVVASENVLKIESGDQADAVTFKLESVKDEKGEEVLENVGGAKSIGDTVFVASYQLKDRFNDKYIVKNGEKIELGTTTNDKFQFISDFTGSKYAMKIVTEDKYVSPDSKTSALKTSSEISYFKLLEEEAPVYGTFETGHKRFTSDAKSLTMNTLNMFAELKVEGQEILKSTYEKDNFSLKLIKSKASTPEMPLYFITTVMANDVAKAEVEQTRYYMVPGRDSALVAADKYMFDGKYRVHFITGDDIENMKDATKNPALFALKVTESGNYLLESYQEMNLNAGVAKVKEYPYVGISNNVVVMSDKGIEFSLENAPSPVANESIEAPTTIKVIGGNGEFQIRNAGGKKVILSNILGQTIGSRFISSDNESVQTARGVVIVSVEGDKAYKVIVK